MGEALSCPHCKASLPGDAVLCVACGYHFPSGRCLVTEREPFEHRWRTGPPLAFRLVGMVAFVVGVVLISVFKQIEIWFIALALAVGLATLLSWTSVVITLRRTQNGRLQLRRQRFIGPIPCGVNEINLKRCSAVAVDCRRGSGPWWMLWSDQSWQWYDSNEYIPDSFSLELIGGKRARPVVLRGLTEITMKEIVDILQEEAGLEVMRR
jgi:hypothetical protein